MAFTPKCWGLGLLLLLLPGLSADSDVDLRDGDDLDCCVICACTPDGLSLDCSHRGLTDIPEGIPDRVIMLNMSNNEISIFPTTLRRYSHLVYLDISVNQLGSLPQDALNNLTKLEILNLSQNSFDSWRDLNPNDLLIPASNIKKLDLSSNQLNTLGNLASEDHLISNSLETLILEDCGIISIHGKSPVSALTAIKTLRLRGNPLRRIQNLISPTLKELDVSNCQLSYVHHDDLMFLPSIETLNMAHNHRLVISTAVGSLSSDSLKHLDISFCNLFQTSLSGFPNLRKAILTGNMVKSLNAYEFHNNTKLEFLDLSSNSISSIQNNAFKGLLLLKSLNLSVNMINSIPEDTFLRTPSLTTLLLFRNHLSEVGHLRSLSITRLDMSICEIVSIGKASLEGIASLVDLNLSRNLLQSLPDTISSNTLRYFDLSNNYLSTINNFTFSMLPRLTVLSMARNRFTTIWGKSYFKSNPYLERMDLNDNTWRCDCFEDEMFEFFEYLVLEPSKREESHNLVCHSPGNVTGMTWQDACFYAWYPGETVTKDDTLLWFLMVMIIGLLACIFIVAAVRRGMKARLAVIQAERERQVEEVRDRMRQLRMQHEQEAQCNAPDPRDLVSPPSYDEALLMPRLDSSFHSLSEVGSGKPRRKKGRRKTKSSGDLLDETERNGNVVTDEINLTESGGRGGQRRVQRFGSHEITELERSPRSRRRRASEEMFADAEGDDFIDSAIDMNMAETGYGTRNGSRGMKIRYGSHDIEELQRSPGARRRPRSMANSSEGVTLQVLAEVERPLRIHRRYSSDDESPRQSDF